MHRRRALVVAAAGLLSACGGPQPSPTPPPAPSPTPLPATPQPTSTRAPAKPTAVPPTVAPTPTAVPSRVELDIRLWNGTAEVQLDGQVVQPGRIAVEPRPHQVAALIDGDVVATADTARGTVDLIVPPPMASLAVMIENQDDARPQTGLTSADVVYEALAEGGITRFVALFLTQDAEVVGPVRSLRHYFAFLAADYGADMIHIGASPEGFAWRDTMNMGHLDESAGDPGVWRIRTRPPPHNAYTNTAADRGFLADRGRQRNRQWGPLRFSPQPPQGLEPAVDISIAFRPWPYRASYAFDADQQHYVRAMDGVPHRDAASGAPIAPSSVVVQFADVQAIPNDPKLRLDVDLVGAAGDLLVFSGGTQRSGRWAKSGARSPTRWLDDTGQPLILPPGQVWVEIVPVGSPLRVA
jgi:hypothetical protein